MRISNRSSKPMSPAMRFFFSRIFPFIFLAVGAGVSYVGVQDIFNAQASEEWPYTYGTIITSEVEYHHSNEGSGTYHARVMYDYEVQGVLYSGDQVAYGDYGSSSPSHARQIVNRYPKAQQVTVFYDPYTPKEAVLEPGLKGQAFFLPIFGSVFFLAGLLMAIFLPKQFHKHLKQPLDNSENN